MIAADMKDLSFDGSRPFSMSSTVTASLSTKCASFKEEMASTCGYMHSVQTVGFDKKSDVHVFSIMMTGLVQEYGFNAIALGLCDEDGACSIAESQFVAYSQNIAPYPCSILTCVYDSKNGTIILFAERGAASLVEHVGAKRKRSIEQSLLTDDCGNPEWYTTHDSKFHWTKIVDSEVYVSTTLRTKRAIDGKPPVPMRLTLWMDGTLGNEARIVNPFSCDAHTHVRQHLQTTLDPPREGFTSHAVWSPRKPFVSHTQSPDTTVSWYM